MPDFEPLMAASPANATYAYGAAIAYEYRGRNAWLLGDRVSAMAWYRKSLALSAKLLSGRTTDVSARVQKMADEGPIATLLALSGERAAAAKMADDLVKEAGEMKDARRDLHLAYAWSWYAQTYEALHDPVKAAEGYEKSAETWKQVIGSSEVPPYEDMRQEALRKAARYRAQVQRNAP